MVLYVNNLSLEYIMLELIDRIAVRFAFLVTGHTFYNWYKHRDLILAPDRRSNQRILKDK